jgi:glyoxylase-like metal-dependent hydrolase (beta-lactamase superfamily II)
VRASVAAIVWFFLACGGGAGGDDAGGSGDDAAGPADDARVADAAVADAAPFDPGPEPTAPLLPVPGEVTIVQLELPATGLLGEAAIIVGPDGTLVLLDVGNSNHADRVREAVRELNTVHLTPARGFAARAPLQVEWIVITHFHADHVGAFEPLVTGDEPLAITGGVVYRGHVDLGEAMNTGHWETFCHLTRGPLAAVDVPLCHAAAAPDCDYAQLAGPFPAVGCPGLRAGDLADPGDDADGAAAFVSLGDGARLTLVAAGGHVVGAEGVVASAPFGHDETNQENARSLAGLVEHGAFRYHFGGDLTGAGTTAAPDIESHLVAVAGPVFYGSLGVDVIHVHHHARRTSSNPGFVAALAPADGRSRNAVAGINAAYYGSPHQEILDVWADDDRLGDGRFWVTKRAVSGGTHAALIDADGPVIVQTIEAGRGYRVQAAGDELHSLAFPSLR